MSLWILDTDCLSLLQRGNPTLIRRTSAVNAKQIAVTIVTAEEQWERKQAKNVHIFIKEIIPKLFCAWVQKVSLYCIVDDSNENTSFAPYIIVGGTCLLVIGQKWDL